MIVLDKIISLWRIPDGADRELCEEYRRLWKKAVVVTVILALIPILILLYVNYNQFGTTMVREKSLHLLNTTLTVKQYFEGSLNKRKTTIQLVTLEHSLSELKDSDMLTSLFESMQSTFSDLASIMIYDIDGNLFNKAGKIFLQNQILHLDLNNETDKGIPKVTDVFYGPDATIYFAIAILYPDKSYLLAFFDTTVFNQVTALKNKKQDIFLINHDRVLQTSSIVYGHAMSQFSATISKAAIVQEGISSTFYNQHEYYFAEIAQSPFVLLVGEPLLSRRKILAKWLSFENKPLIFFLFSTIFGLIFIMGSAGYMIAFVRDADMQRAAMLQNVELEHTNKLASIGRLAAGVAHEINNPLAIINQKAGLMEDLMMISDEFPHKNELSELIGAIHNAVKRCSTVTHRLLGFARHMDTTIETVDLNKVITDVSSFLEKEAEHRKVKVGLHLFEKPALIESDRGQLEQVFLNIINNAFEAVDDGGKINITVEEKWEVTRHEDVMKFYSEAFEVTVSDNGKGIMEKHLKHIFEPFFTTKDHYSTGLGLSLTYGIVKKLGGTIHVHSHFGKGSTFVVTLYKKRKIVIAQPTPM